MLSSDEELQGFFQELRERGKENEVVRMRVILLGEEGGGRKGEGQGHAEMDVEVEEGAVEAQKESEVRLALQ